MLDLFYGINYGPVAPSPLPGALTANVAFSHICGQYSHLVLFSEETGKFYWWGKHADLGNSSFYDVVESPARMGEFANATIAELACNTRAVLVRTSTGDAWVFGSNAYSGFGNGEWNITYVPPSEAVKIPFPMPVKKIFGNSGTVFGALTEYYSYAWGIDGIPVGGTPGQLQAIRTPQIITFNGDPVQNATDATVNLSSFLVLPRPQPAPPAPSTPQPAPPVAAIASDNTMAVWLLAAAILAVVGATFVSCIFF